MQPPAVREWDFGEARRCGVQYQRRLHPPTRSVEVPLRPPLVRLAGVVGEAAREYLAAYGVGAWAGASLRRAIEDLANSTQSAYWN